MKKTIKHLVQQLQEVGNGTVKGGFASIRGGVGLPVEAEPNKYCTNTMNCGTNAIQCTNSFCEDTTNKKGCSNTFTCII